MSATFASPVAAVLLAVELLLFEWKPRSLIPVALASAVAAVLRRYILGMGPLFSVPEHPLFIGPKALLGCALVGLLAGILSALLTLSVYAAEDAFQKLPIHWMWWPAIGGLIIGIGGYFFPQALGVGYDTIGALLQGDVTRRVIFGILIVKSSIWALSLGSGTSGGVLAPLLMMGGALGGLEAQLPADVAHFGVGEIGNKQAQCVARPAGVRIRECDDVTCRLAYGPILRRHLATALAVDQAHAWLAIRNPLHDLIRPIGRGVRGDDDLDPLRRVVKLEQVDEATFDHRLLVVCGDDDGDRRFCSCDPMYRPRPMPSPSTSHRGVENVRPRERRRRAEEESLD
jgi:hypothetical protein